MSFVVVSWLILLARNYCPPIVTIVTGKPYAYEWQLFPITVLLKLQGNSFDSLRDASRSVVLHLIHKTVCKA